MLPRLNSKFDWFQYFSVSSEYDRENPNQLISQAGIQLKQWIIAKKNGVHNGSNLLVQWQASWMISADFKVNQLAIFTVFYKSMIWKMSKNKRHWLKSSRNE